MQKWISVTKGKTHTYILFNFSTTYKLNLQEAGKIQFALGKCAYMYFCVCAWPQTSIHTHVAKSQPRLSFSRICPLCFWNKISHCRQDPWSSWAKLSKRLSGQQVPGVYPSLPPQDFCGCWNWTKLPAPVQQTFSDWAISPAPGMDFFLLFYSNNTFYLLYIPTSFYFFPFLIYPPPHPLLLQLHSQRMKFWCKQPTTFILGIRGCVKLWTRLAMFI